MVFTNFPSTLIAFENSINQKQLYNGMWAMIIRGQPARSFDKSSRKLLYFIHYCWTIYYA